MDSGEKFCLRWNDFERNISTAFTELKKEKELFDCTLSCGSRQIETHKLILSSCSPFFRSIIKLNPHQHPLLYLKGVEFSHLQAILDFMYHGEVNVSQEDLNAFLAVADDLQIKGLSSQETLKNKSNVETSTVNEIFVPHNQNVLQTSTKKSKISKRPKTDENDDIIEIVHNVKEEPESTMNVGNSTYNESYEVQDLVAENNTEIANIDQSYNIEDGLEMTSSGYDAYDIGEPGDQNNQSSEMFEDINKHIYDDRNGSGFTCTLCGKGFGLRKDHCRRHIRSTHNSTENTHTCQYCSKGYKTYDSLRNHERSAHGLYRQ